MKTFKLFGCQDFITGGKIVSIISLLENFVKIVVSVVFLLLVNFEVKKDVNKRGEKKFKIFETEKLELNLVILLFQTIIHRVCKKKKRH